MKVWQCSVCKYTSKGKNPPEKCPVCGVPSKKFKEIDEASIAPKPGANPPGKKKDINHEPIKLSMVEKIKDLMIKHHAHPIAVHTPNGIMPFAALLFIGAWIVDYDLFAKAAFINIIFVLLALPFVIYTGILEWQTKYRGALTKVFKKKIAAASITAVFTIISFIWYIIDPDVLSSPNAWLFILINIIIVAAVGIAGHIGGKLVFKK